MKDAPFLSDLGWTAWSVAIAVVPLVAMFLLFQTLFLRLPKLEVRRILKGTLIASAGLFLFLLGIGVGFLPFGRAMGESAASLGAPWLVAFGALLGFVTTWGEPSVRILAHEVETASAGSLRRTLVLSTICVGVAVAVGLGMLRIALGIPILWILLPGYALVVVMLWISEKSFVSIAIDAGGVATGPLANTFLLALGFGVASAANGGQDSLVHGLGLVALIALAPVVSLMALGLLVRWKERRKET